MTDKATHIVFPIFDRVTHLDFTGPHQVFSYLTEARITVASMGGRDIGAHGFVFSELADLSKVESCDVLCVPGGSGTTEAMLDETFIAEIQRLARGARYLTSVCTGSLILGAAGLLRGKRATTHWATHELRMEYAPAPPFGVGRPDIAAAELMMSVRESLKSDARRMAVEQVARKLRVS
jgi:putative intracellular protease/amidase